ncbi:MAG: hypothetical protein CW742_12685 [Methanoregula sp.]|nr:MAG: hypothetical protein CW742_12685 [Methanoregula sp.]
MGGISSSQPPARIVILVRIDHTSLQFTEKCRIVAKIDASMQICDALESRLKERVAIDKKTAM